MNRIIHKLNIAGILCCLLLVSSCKKEDQDIFSKVKGTYFSINKFILEEWSTRAQEAVTFKKTVKLNGKVDSSFVNTYKMDWSPIIKLFSEADISDRKYLGRYNFSEFTDQTDNTHNFLYVALNKDLFTQKLLISVDELSKEVKGIYIETNKSNIWNSTYQKLLYSPNRSIQIQQIEKPLIGSKKDLLISYSSKSE